LFVVRILGGGDGWTVNQVMYNKYHFLSCSCRRMKSCICILIWEEINKQKCRWILDARVQRMST
jgi:hypothetical protein